MFLIDRSFNHWKAAKVFPLAKKVVRTLEFSKSVKPDEQLLQKLKDAIVAVERINNKRFVQMAQQKEELDLATTALKEALMAVAGQVEKGIRTKSDVNLTGFISALKEKNDRTKRNTKYISSIPVANTQAGAQPSESEEDTQLKAGRLKKEKV